MSAISAFQCCQCLAIRTADNLKPLDGEALCVDCYPAAHARKLAKYIQTVYCRVRNKMKFLMCLPSIILDCDRGRDPIKLAEEINEHG